MEKAREEMLLYVFHECVTFDPINDKIAKEVLSYNKTIPHVTEYTIQHVDISRDCRYEIMCIFVCVYACAYFVRWPNKIYARRVPSIFAIVENITNANTEIKYRRYIIYRQKNHAVSFKKNCMNLINQENTIESQYFL